MKIGHWLALVLCALFSALSLVVGGQEEHPPCKKAIPLILRGSLPEKVEEHLIQVHMVKRPFSDSSSSTMLKNSRIAGCLLQR